MGWQDIPGRAAYLWMYDEFVATAPKDARVAEVGVGLGKSFAYLAELCHRSGRGDIGLFGVDAWGGFGRNAEQQALANPENDYELFEKMMREHCPNVINYPHTAPNWPTVTIVRRVSWEVPEWVWFTGFDLVVIDAAHDYESVCKDIDAWAPFIEKGGYIGGDDYVPEYPGVIQAVKERFSESQVEVRHDQNWGTWRVKL